MQATAYPWRLMGDVGTQSVAPCLAFATSESGVARIGEWRIR